MPVMLPSHLEVTGSLRTLVVSTECFPHDMSLGEMQKIMAQMQRDFFAVVKGKKPLGVCSRSNIGMILGSQYGYALHSRDPLEKHVLNPMTVLTDSMSLIEALEKLSVDPVGQTPCDAVLVDDDGEFIGLIPILSLLRHQTSLLKDHVDLLARQRAQLQEQKQQMDEDLALAREMQEAMLGIKTHEFRSIRGRLTITPAYHPNSLVGGDYFQVLPITNEKIGLFVADAMGHGVRAAMVTSILKAYLFQIRHLAPHPCRLMEELNSMLCQLFLEIGQIQMLTALYCVIDLDLGHVLGVNAGHPTPIIFGGRKAASLVLPSCQACLGLEPSTTYKVSSFLIEKNQRLLFYSDGLIEAENSDGQWLSLDTILNQIQSVSPKTPYQKLLTQFLDLARSFTRPQEPADDICLIGVEYDAPDQEPETEQK